MMSFDFDPKETINYQDKALETLKETAQQDLSQRMWGEMKEKALRPINRGEEAVGEFLDLDDKNLFGRSSIDRAFDGSAGSQVNRMLDALGLPDQVGDVVGTQVDAQRGDIKGMMRNLSDFTASSEEDLSYLFDQAVTRVLG